MTDQHIGGRQDHTPPGAEGELPGLSGIAGFIRWIEELIALLSGPLLTIGLAIALIDLLTGGDLLRSVPLLLFAWGACQAVGIDSQLVATFDKLRRALRDRRWWVAVGLLLLGLMLGYVGFVSAEAFGFQHAFQVTEAQALARLGIDPISWQLQRAILAVFLVALSGFTRYHPPARSYSAKAADEAERLQHEIALEPLRAQARAAKLRNAREAVKVALGREGQQAPQPEPVMLDVFTPGRNGHKPVAAAPVTLPLIEPQQHSITANKMMHDWDIPDEVAGDDDPNMTTFIPSVSRPLDHRTPRAYEKAQKSGTSAAAALYGGDDFDALDEEQIEDDEVDYPSSSAHQRKQAKTAKGRRNQRQRKVALEVNTQSDRERQRAIKQATWTVRYRAAAEGIRYSEDKLVTEVNAELKRQGSAIRTSRTAVRNWSRGWENERHHRQRQEHEQQDMPPIVADDIVAMLETEHEEALV